MQPIQRKAEQEEILVLDNEAQVLRGLVGNLRMNKAWNVHGFSYAQEALDFLKQHPVGLMLVDFKLENTPHLTGIEVLEQAKQIQPLATQILISGKVEKADAVKAINRLDLYYLILKPCLPEDLLDITAKGLERYRLQKTAKRYLEELEESNAKLRETERELREANKHLRLTQEDLLRQQKQAAIGALVQGICHNLNTPLGLILGHIEQLCDSLEQFEEERGFPPIAWRPSMRTIHEAMNRILALIENLISKSRMEQDPERRPLNLAEALQQELAFLQADPFLRHHVQVSLDLPKEMPMFRANYADISQIFGNLVRNALDAMIETAEPKLHLRVFVEARYIGFELHDNGPGVPVALRERIFDPFFTTKRLATEGTAQTPMVLPIATQGGSGSTDATQSDREQMWKRNMSGAGLGLYSVTQILQSYQGDIKATTSEKWGGACFCVRFPLQSTANKDT